MMKKRWLILLIVLISVILFLQSGVEERRIEGNSLARGNPGDGDITYEIEAEIGDLKVRDINISIDGRDYSYEECEELYESFKEDAKRLILGNNTDSENIHDDLCFVDRITGYPFQISYYTDKPDKMDDSGRILSQDPFSISIEMIISYKEYVKSEGMTFEIKPDLNIKERVMRSELLAKLEDANKSDKKAVYLPTEINGEKVSYYFPREGKNFAILILGAVLVAAVIIGEKEEQRNLKRKRREAIIREYPVLLRKMSLYLSAGMNIRTIWMTIYEEETNKNKKINPIYEEMGVSINELINGESEIAVYSSFGERTEIPELMRFVVLLSQNLKKGSSRLKDLLDEELRKAYMEKRQAAIKKGEQAGTKLLAPMMILLIDVMIVIVVPAFWSI